MKSKLESLTNFGLSNIESQQIKGGITQAWCRRAYYSAIVHSTFVGINGDEVIQRDDAEDEEGIWV